MNSIEKNIIILFLAADPTNASRLRLGEEFREIQEKCRLAKFRDNIDLQLRLSVRPTDISQVLLDIAPPIVHFSGHGTKAGKLCFENVIGEIQAIQPDALASLFEEFSEQVSCVLLNACFSELQAKAIAQHIRYVIGMNKEIGDEAAIAFSIGFYQALGAGRTIEEAYRLGCVQIRLQGIDEYSTPKLIKKASSMNSTRFGNEKSKFKPLTSNKSFTPLDYKLIVEAEEMSRLVQELPDIQILEAKGNPPKKYILKFQLEGVRNIDEKGIPRIANEHIVEVDLNDSHFPMRLPHMKFLTPIFHPNICETGEVCCGWFDYPCSLTALCIHIAKMIDYQIYEALMPPPINHKASEWVLEKQERFPLKNWKPYSIKQSKLPQSEKS